jgi:hypothetical protein
MQFLASLRNGPFFGDGIEIIQVMVIERKHIDILDVIDSYYLFYINKDQGDNLAKRVLTERFA